MDPGDACYLLLNEVKLEIAVQGYLTSVSEFSSIVESVAHFLAPVSMSLLHLILTK